MSQQDRSVIPLPAASKSNIFSGTRHCWRFNEVRDLRGLTIEGQCEVQSKAHAHLSRKQIQGTQFWFQKRKPCPPLWSSCESKGWLSKSEPGPDPNKTLWLILSNASRRLAIRLVGLLLGILHPPRENRILEGTCMFYMESRIVSTKDPSVGQSWKHVIPEQSRHPKHASTTVSHGVKPSGDSKSHPTEKAVKHSF